MSQHHRNIVVVKIGGSVLTDVAAYRRAADFVAHLVQRRPQERAVVVVSAQFGHTDELLDLARGVTPDPSRSALDLLWATGELRSVALLALHLERIGVRAAGLNVHQCGLVAGGLTRHERTLRVDRPALLEQLRKFEVVVVPGFLARDKDGTIVSLGRGGSDLTAVLLSHGLEAERCELIKDVPGYFERDPNLFPGAARLPALSYDEALRLADEGCDLVQRRAIEEAQRTRTRLVVRSLDPNAAHSVVSEERAFSSARLEPVVETAAA